jgi:hypothetical protein
MSKQRLKLPKPAASKSDQQRQAFRKKFGREPGPDDSVFFKASERKPFSLQEVENEGARAMRQAGISEEIPIVNPEIERLEADLSRARYIIVKLGTHLAVEYEKSLPPPVPPDPDNVVTLPGVKPPSAPPAERPLEQLLTDYCLCHSRFEFGEWWFAVIDRIIGLASRAATTPGGRQPERAACPFCGIPGWAVREGLRRHLEGAGNTSHCDVASELYRQADRSLQEKFARDDRAAAELDAARRRSKPSFLIRPLRAPELLDEGFIYGDRPRDADGLAAAEERLRELGFVIEADRNVIAWKYRQEPYAVLADPRSAKRLTFCVYDETRIAAASRKGGRRPVSWGSTFSVPLTVEFYLLDTWRNDIVGKFRTGLQWAIAALDRDGTASDRRKE